MSDDAPNDKPDPSGMETIKIPPLETELLATRLTFAAKTHVGLVRSNNEDSYLVVRACRSLETLRTNLFQQTACGKPVRGVVRPG